MMPTINPLLSGHSFCDQTITGDHPADAPTPAINEKRTPLTVEEVMPTSMEPTPSRGNTVKMVPFAPHLSIRGPVTNDVSTKPRRKHETMAPRSWFEKLKQLIISGANRAYVYLTP
jgi:hypothetical protein